MDRANDIIVCIMFGVWMPENMKDFFETLKGLGLSGTKYDIAIFCCID